MGSLSASRALRPGGAATAPLRPGTTTTILGSRRPEQSIIAIYCAERVKSRPDTDFPDTSDRCLSRLLSAGPRPRASRAGPGSPSAEAGPRWGGAETKHAIHVQQQFRRSSARGALTPCLALESSWKAQTRVFGPSRGVSRNRSRPRRTKTPALATQQNLIISSAPPSARPARR